MQLINAMFILLLPTLNTLAMCLIFIRMSIQVLFVPLLFALVLTFIATEFLERLWNKDFIAHKALAVLINLVGIFSLLKNLMLLMTGYTQRNEVIHAVIAADTGRDDMVNIKSTSIVFRRFTAFLANFITFTNGLSNFRPSVPVVDAAPAIIPMVLTNYPLIHMSPINKEKVGFPFSFDAVWRQFKRFTTSTSAFYLCSWLAVGLTDLYLGCIRMLLPIKAVMGSTLDSPLTFFGATRHQFRSVIGANFKRIAANHAYLLYMRMVMSARWRAVLQAFIRGRERFLTMQTGKGIFTLSIVGLAFTHFLQCLYALLRAACNLLFGAGYLLRKRFTADDTRYLCCVVYTLVLLIAEFRAELSSTAGGCLEGFAASMAAYSNRHNIILSSQDSSSISVRRLVTKPALSVGDQPTQAYFIIFSLGWLVKRKGQG